MTAAHHPLNCNHCRENDSVRQVKAGCGHLVHICEECESEVNHIQHSSCRGCKVGGYNGKTPEQILQEDQRIFLEHYPSFHDFDYDGLLDEMDNPAYPFSCDMSDAQEAMDEEYDPLEPFDDLYDY